MRRCLWGCAGVLLLLVAVGAGSAAEDAHTITVQPGESIQAAINAAPAGAVVCLPAGEWLEALTIGKPLTLRGAGNGDTILRGQAKDRAGITANVPGAPGAQVVVEGLSLIGFRRGIWLDGSLHATILHTTVSDCTGAYGIYIDGSARATIINSRVVTSEEFGFAITGSAHVTIVGCTVENSGSIDIGLLESSRVTIADCAFSGTPAGIWVSSQARAVVTGCTFSDNGSSLSLRNFGQATVADCTIVGARGSGVLLQDGSQITMNGCSISSSDSGITLHDSTSAAISDCRIAANSTYGICLLKSAEAVVVGNEIVENGTAGLCLSERPCVDTSTVFSGHIAGRGNLIPGPAETMGNLGTGACPDELLFLLTAEGGELDRRATP